MAPCIMSTWGSSKSQCCKCEWQHASTCMKHAVMQCPFALQQTASCSKTQETTKGRIIFSNKDLIQVQVNLHLNCPNFQRNLLWGMCQNNAPSPRCGPQCLTLPFSSRTMHGDMSCVRASRLMRVRWQAYFGGQGSVGSPLCSMSFLGFFQFLLPTPSWWILLGRGSLLPSSSPTLLEVGHVKSNPYDILCLSHVDSSLKYAYQLTFEFWPAKPWHAARFSHNCLQPSLLPKPGWPFGLSKYILEYFGDACCSYTCLLWNVEAEILTSLLQKRTPTKPVWEPTLKIKKI